MQKAKKVLLGITAGIAAYKSADLARQLKKANYDIRVAMTPDSQEFITPLTLQAVSGRPVANDLFDRESEAAMGHIELARWPDLIVIAPASADFIARLVHGHADDLLATLCLATHTQIALAPAMNRVMWDNPATQNNIATLKQRGVLIWGPASGDQACGEVGPGRMCEPVELIKFINDYFTHCNLLSGKKVLITAGPTHEMLDPVRYFTNLSSGKMGYALAEAARSAGAQVTLISGPTHLTQPAVAQFISVLSAQEMLTAVMEKIADQDIFIATAAVADYRPKQVSQQKIKKQSAHLTVELEPNPDILATVANLKKRPYIVGFAAETENLFKNAEQKLNDKKIDLLVANEVGAGKGFQVNHNKALLFQLHKEPIALPLIPKTELARIIIQYIAEGLI